jgi:hypothetical protein
VRSGGGKGKWRANILRAREGHRSVQHGSRCCWDTGERAGVKAQL